jgi:hypothetical protein
MANSAENLGLVDSQELTKEPNPVLAESAASVTWTVAFSHGELQAGHELQAAVVSCEQHDRPAIAVDAGVPHSLCAVDVQVEPGQVEAVAVLSEQVLSEQVLSEQVLSVLAKSVQAVVEHVLGWEQAGQSFDAAVSAAHVPFSEQQEAASEQHSEPAAFLVVEVGGVSSPPKAEWVIAQLATKVATSSLIFDAASMLASPEKSVDWGLYGIL